MPVYRRPIRTFKAIGSIISQTVTDWEGFVLGDGCPDYPRYIKLITDNRILTFNTPINYGGCGYHQTNYAIQCADGKYFVFLGNDDYLLPNHFENYLSEIEGTDLDFVWFPWAMNQGRPYRFRLRSWHIGHAGLIIRTDFLKRMPPHEKAYNHDWSLVKNMIDAGAKYKKGNDRITYCMDPYGWRGTGKDGDHLTRGMDTHSPYTKLKKWIKSNIIPKI